MRFYEIDSGKIAIDGVSISDIKRENLHDWGCARAASGNGGFKAVSVWKENL